MSNEINVTGMKKHLKKHGKFFFWNFLSAAILGGLFSFMGWAVRLQDAPWEFLLFDGMDIEIASPSEESAGGCRTSFCIL